MKTPFELAQVIEQFEHQLPPGRLMAHHRQALSAIRRCRTAALGGHVDACEQCGYLRISYIPICIASCPTVGLLLKANGNCLGEAMPGSFIRPSP